MMKERKGTLSELFGRGGKRLRVVVVDIERGKVSSRSRGQVSVM